MREHRMSSSSSTYAPSAKEKIRSEHMVKRETEHDIDYFFRLLRDDTPQSTTVVEEEPQLSHERSVNNNSSSNSCSNRSLTGVLLKNLWVRIPHTQTKNDDHDQHRESPPLLLRRQFSFRSSFSGNNRESGRRTSPRSVRSTSTTTNFCSRTADLTLRSYMWGEYSDNDEEDYVEDHFSWSPKRLLCFADRPASSSEIHYMDVVRDQQRREQQQLVAGKNWFVIDTHNARMMSADKGNSNQHGIMHTVFYDSNELPVVNDANDEFLSPTETAF